MEKILKYSNKNINKEEVDNINKMIEISTGEKIMKLHEFELFLLSIKKTIPKINLKNETLHSQEILKYKLKSYTDKMIDFLIDLQEMKISTLLLLDFENIVLDTIKYFDEVLERSSNFILSEKKAIHKIEERKTKEEKQIQVKANEKQIQVKANEKQLQSKEEEKQIHLKKEEIKEIDEQLLLIWSKEKEDEDVEWNKLKKSSIELSQKYFHPHFSTFDKFNTSKTGKFKQDFSQQKIGLESDLINIAQEMREAALKHSEILEKDNDCLKRTGDDQQRHIDNASSVTRKAKFLVKMKSMSFFKEMIFLAIGIVTAFFMFLFICFT